MIQKKLNIVPLQSNRYPERDQQPRPGEFGEEREKKFHAGCTGPESLIGTKGRP